MSRPRTTKILDSYSIGTNGEVVTEELPEYPVNSLIITQIGTNDTDQATQSEILAGIGTIELLTAQGTPIKIDAEDLFYLNQDMFKKVPYISSQSSADNYRYVSLVLPLNPFIVDNPFNMSMGISPSMKPKIKISTGSDTDSGMSNRLLKITAVGVEGQAPSEFMGYYQDVYNTNTGDNFIDIQQDRVSKLLGIYGKMVTSPEDVTSTDATGIETIGWAIQKSIREKMDLDEIQALNNNLDPDNQNTHYALLDIGINRGQGIGHKDGLQVYINSGVSEDITLYPLLTVRN